MSETVPTSHPRCSAKGCRDDATTDLRWRNPALHDAARVKHWLACDEHTSTLGSFLSARGFLLGQEPYVHQPDDADDTYEHLTNT